MKKTGTPRVAYFSMEIALEPDIPTYSGGLGILAGDTLRSAADLGTPVVAVTLAYRKGYFRQILDASGNQFEQPQEWDPEIMSRLRREMEHMIVDKKLRGHPMLGTIWEGVVKSKYEEMRLQQSRSQSRQLQPPPLIFTRARSRATSEPPQSQPPSLTSPPTSVSTLPPRTEDAYTYGLQGQSREGSPVHILESSPEPVPIKRSPSKTPGYVRARSLDLIAQESRL